MEAEVSSETFVRVTPGKTVILKSWVCAVCCAETQDARDNLQEDSMERSIDRPSVQRHVPASSAPHHAAFQMLADLL